MEREYLIKTLKTAITLLEQPEQKPVKITKGLLMAILGELADALGEGIISLFEERTDIIEIDYESAEFDLEHDNRLTLSGVEWRVAENSYEIGTRFVEELERFISDEEVENALDNSQN